MGGMFFKAGQSTKTYKNRAYGISIEYPRDWKKKEGKREAVVLFLAPKTLSGQSFTANVNITCEHLGQSITLDQYVKSTMEREQQFIDGYQLNQIETTTLSQQEARSIAFTGKHGYASIRFWQICTIKNERAYAVTCAAEAGKFEAFMDVARDMIASMQIMV